MANITFKIGNTWTSIYDIIYPVGSIYLCNGKTGSLTPAGTASPATLFGGTWASITGRFLYANSGYGTGGSNNLIIPYHNHGISGGITSSGGHTTGAGSSHSHGIGSYSTVSNGGHTHQVKRYDSSVATGTARVSGPYDQSNTTAKTQITTTSNGSHTHTLQGTSGGESSHTHSVSSHTHTNNFSINYAGTSGNTTNANMPAYREVWAWERTA